MSAFTIMGTSRLGAKSNCHSCGAGSVISFDWGYLEAQGDIEDRARLDGYQFWMQLRRGELHRCKICGEVWHLDGARQTMNYVNAERLPLVLDWNQNSIEVSQSMTAKLTAIGPTPPDSYGNGIDRRVTPCKVLTTGGEEIDPAMICIQLDAPIQDFMHFRLGNEIADILPSSVALPLDVRIESSRAQEMRMGFSPTLIEMHDGKKFVLNGMTSFFVERGYRAADARVADGSYFAEEPTPPFSELPKITYFIVDGDPGWICPSEESSTS